MRMRKVDNEIEKQIVTGAIISTKYLKELPAIYNPDYIAIPFARTVIDWCLKYFEQYEQAPGQDIQSIFESHRRNGLPEEQATLIEEFLTNMSDEYERAEMFNVEYLLDETEKRFEARNQSLLADDVRALHSRGDYAAAETLIAGYKKVQRPANAGINPLTDEEATREAFEDISRNILFRFPGVLGDLVGDVAREDLIGILAPEKRGKTWRCIDFAMRGLRSKCNVAYFDAGDMTQNKATMRIHTYNSKRSPKYYGALINPVLDCAHSQSDECRKRERVSRMGVLREVHRNGKATIERMTLEEAREYKPCIVCMRDAPYDYQGAVWHEIINTEELTWQYAHEMGMRTSERSRKQFKLSCHASGTLNVKLIESTLDSWEREDGFIADLIIADYPDIFAPEDPKVKETRHRQNETWLALRRLSQQRHAAVVVPTQADAESYDQKNVKESNFSEDKRKYGHATKFMALNQTPEEKRDGIMRISMMFVREDDWETSRQVAVLQNLKIGQPYLGSYWA